MLTLDEQLRHRDESEDIRRKHALDVCILDVSDMFDAQDVPGIVNYRRSVLARAASPI